MINQFVMLLIWIGLLALFRNSDHVKKVECICGEYENRFNFLYLMLFFLPIILMATYRETDFGDTRAYINSYLSAPASLSAIPSYVAARQKDAGFSVFTVLVKATAGGDYRVFFFTIAAIQGLLLCKFFQKYSYHAVLSVFLFVISTDYVGWMFNGIRQFLAVTIAISATGFLLNKRYVPSLIIILIAASIHQTALLMIPFSVIAMGKAWNKRTLLFILAITLVLAFLSQFTDILDNSLQGTQYENVVRYYKEMDDDGTNPLRVIVYAVPFIFALFCRKRIAESNSPLIHLCTNMTLLTTGIYIVSMFTSGIYVGRLPIYTSLYGYMILPWEIEQLFSKRMQTMVYGALIVLYFVFYYYQMHTIGLL